MRAPALPTLIGYFFGGILCFGVFALGVSTALIAAPPATQTSSGGSVEVKVTPRQLSSNAAVWEFELTLDTHTVALTGDPMQYSRLVDSKGREHAPLSWEGNPPGGHHRTGLLRFKPLPGETQVELRLKNVGGVPVRDFRWPIAAE